MLAGESPLTVAWLSFFPIEWLPERPAALRDLPRQHPASWQRVLLDELKGRPGLKLHVFSVRKQYPHHLTFEWEGVTFHCVKVPGGLRTLSLFWWETVLLGGRLRRIRPDIVQAWGTERGAALVASRLRYPYLVTMQGLLEWYLQRVDLGRVMRLESKLERISLRRASVVTVESNFGVDWLRRHYPHLEVRQAEHAPNWLFHRVERRPQTQPLQFLFVGLMSLIKGTDVLVQALDRLRTELDFRLTIIGTVSPPFMQRLKELTSPALWERITLRHGLTQPEVADEMARATMVLFPTRADNSPNSVKESVVAGVPVVASGIGGILDYVVPGRNGLLFCAGNLEELVQAIRAAAAHPLFREGKVEPDTLARMRQYLSPAVMAERFLAAYRRVAERGR